MCSYAFLGWKSLSGGATTNFLSRLSQILLWVKSPRGSEEQEDPGVKGNVDMWEEDSRISSWGTKVEGRQELQARLPTPQRAEGQCGPWKMNKEGYGRKEQQRRTSPRMHSSQQGVSAGGRASRCSEQSRLKAEM